MLNRGHRGLARRVALLADAGVVLTACTDAGPGRAAAGLTVLNCAD
jgi:hypothetical protein